MIYKFILTFILSVHSMTVFSQSLELNYTANCGDVDREMLLIQKGIMTKNLCIKADSEKLKLLIQGEAYALGQYLVHKGKGIHAFYSAKTPKKNFQCGGANYNEAALSNLEESERVEILERINYLSDMANENFPKEEFIKLRKFLKMYKKRVIDLQTVAGATANFGNIELQATGYADGVRNLDDDYDQHILNQLAAQDEINTKTI